MKTKLLLSAAVLGMASIVDALAEISLNIPVPPGFSMIANQLDNSGGNTVAVLLPSVPIGTTLYKYLPPSGYDINTFEFGEWSQPDMTLNPGEGAVIFNPGDEFDALFVGEVTQGELSIALVAGVQIVASQVPLSGALDTDLGFPVEQADAVALLDNASGDFSVFLFDLGEWIPRGTVVIHVGEAFFLHTHTDRLWTQTFNGLNVSP